MRPLTLTTPKPLLTVAGKPLVQHIAEALPPEVNELILVIGYLGEKIQGFCGERFAGRPVRYVRQEKKLGTADALKRCRPFLAGDRFLVVNGDDLIGRECLRECMRHDRALVVAEHDEPQRFGVVTLRADGTVAEVIEKPAEPQSNLVSTGVMLLDEEIFRYEPELHPNGEYYLANMFDKMLKGGHMVHAVKTAEWFPIAAPEDLPAAELFARRRHYGVE